MSVPRFGIEPDIELRALESTGVPALEALGDGYTSHRDEWLFSPGSARDFIETALSANERCGRLTLGIFEHGILAGVLMCNVDSEQKSVSFDYMLGNRYRGRGLVTRSVCRLIQHFFERREFVEAWISVDPGNVKSCAVAVRLGFSVVETVRGAITSGSELGDIARYRLTSSEWTPPLNALPVYKAV